MQWYKLFLAPVTHSQKFFRCQSPCRQPTVVANKVGNAKIEHLIPHRAWNNGPDLYSRQDFFLL